LLFGALMQHCALSFGSRDLLVSDDGEFHGIGVFAFLRGLSIRCVPGVGVSDDDASESEMGKVSESGSVNENGYVD